jgi:hypothetical protein
MVAHAKTRLITSNMSTAWVFRPYKYIYIICFVLYVTYICPMICMALSDTLMEEILKHMKLDWKGKTASQLSMNWAPLPRSQLMLSKNRNSQKINRSQVFVGI